MSKKLSYKGLTFSERKSVWSAALEKLTPEDRIIIDSMAKEYSDSAKQVGIDSVYELLSALGMYLVQNEVKVAKKSRP